MTLYYSRISSGAPLLTALVLALISLVGLTRQTWAKSTSVPTLNRLAPGELLDLLEGREKAVLPQGVQLRAVYPRGISVTKAAEGWVPHLYNDAVHYCTIGYGHLLGKAPCKGTERVEVAPGTSIQARRGLTEPQGSFVLDDDMATAKYVVMTAVKPQLTDGQFAALADFVFNVGGQNFRNSGLLQVVNNGQFDRVPAQFRRWVLAGGKRWPGLVSRREQEITVFFDGLPKPKAVPPLPGEKLSPVDIRMGE